MATPAQHRTSAEYLLETARRHALTDPARSAYLAEAQVHATLALAPAPARKATTAKEDK
jgi:hypothetical protein